MTIKRFPAPWILALVCASALAGAGLAATSKPQFGDWGFDAPGMDAAVKPGDDFFKYVNGGWDARTEIPADKAGYGVDFVMSDAAEQHVRSILEADPSADAGADGRKIHAAYLAFMDEAKAQALGAGPIAPDLAAIRAATDRADLAALMGRGNVGFQSSLFDADLDPDEKNPTRYAAYISQGGLGLPDRDYYLQPSFAAKKAAYQAYVAQLLTLAGWPDPAASAAAVVDFETKVAEASWTRAERRDPDKTYNPMSPAELAKAAPGFDWSAWLKTQGLGGASRVVVQENTALPKLAAIFAATPAPTLQAWAAFHVADNAAPYLDNRFERARFDFRLKLLQGQQSDRARWKRAVAFVDGGMGEAVGRAYVAKYFPPEAKAKIDALVAELRVALNQRIDRVGWMSAETKAKAHAKLAQFTVKIAYPDKWRDYAALSVSADDLAGDARAFKAFEWNRQLKRMNGPVDRAEWGMTPQTVNAYYDGVQNEIVFPAAILAPPYFDPAADPAANYGGIGAIIGHEMTHGFDDEGRKFDGAGRLADWWTKEDAAKFETAAKKLNAQYDTYSPFPGVHVKGDQTTGENIADLGGILIALDAYHNSLHGQPAPVIDGLTGDQRFFLAYAQSWRDKRREDAIRNMIVGDVHSPELYRVNGVVRNVDAWYAAFDVKPGAALYLAPAERVRIW
ncbi:MAG TPA: M13-type metalloendopeptidase [Caulobacteraceae bacterium]|jgi:putative endopeptidase|nr:M13-type metalloendopeptidase [Caulobacteraceae bacterium]